MMIASILLVLSMAEHQQHHWLHTTPQQQSDREIVLADALLFNVTYDYAKMQEFIARHHRDIKRPEVEAWNKPIKAWQWEREVEWRRDCWAELRDALDYNRDEPRVYVRLASLYRLRNLIGNEAFYAGAMPNPTPIYKVLPR